MIPQCVVEIYPYEGGLYSLQGGAIISLMTDKPLRGAGTFQMTLAPGGPRGINTSPSWTEIITPQSFVLIGMRRGKYAQIVMLGVVTDIVQPTEWGDTVERSITIRGVDLTYFFIAFNYYTLSMLGMTAGTVIGNAAGFGPVAFPEMLQKGYYIGAPAEIGALFFRGVMLRMLDNTVLPFRGGKNIYLRDALADLFESYPDIKVPFAMGAMNSEGTWLQKFNEIFPWPFYEFFVTAAPQGYYSGMLPQDAVTTGSSGKEFAMTTAPSIPPVIPTVIARLNPLPETTVQAKGVGLDADITGIDVSRWATLKIHTPDPSYLSSTVSFSSDEVRNSYVLNPVGLQNLVGAGNSNTSFFTFGFLGAMDVASIKRYGYHPEVTTTQWLYDPTGAASQNGEVNVAKVGARLLSRVWSYYEPSPLMARATVVLNLRPDILPGTKLRYIPFKGGAEWDFYIESVSHQYTFGGSAVTTLTLTRGLPASVYASAAKDGMLFQVHVGDAMRQGGYYTSPLPKGVGPALLTFGAGNQPKLQEMLASISDAWRTPGQK